MFTSPSPRPSESLHSVARGSALNLAGGIANGLLGFVFILIATRALSPGGAGVLFEGIALFTIIDRVALLGSDVGLVRLIADLQHQDATYEIRRLLRMALVPVAVVGVILALAVFLAASRLSSVFVHGFPVEVGANVFRVLAPFLPLSSLSIAILAATRSHGSMLPFVSVDFVGKPAMRVLLALVLFSVGIDVTWLALAWAIPILIGLVVSAVWLIHSLNLREDGVEHGDRQSSSFLQFWRFAIPRGLAGLIDSTLLWLNLLLLGALGSASQVGIFTVVSRIAIIGLLPLQAAILAVQPSLGRLFARGDHAGAESLYQTSTWWVTAISWPFLVVAAVFAPTLLGVFGPEFQAGQAALLTLAVAMLIDVSTGPVDNVILMAGRSSMNLWNSALGLAVMVPLDVLLIPRLGMLGAALGWGAGVTATNTAALLEVWFALHMNPFGAGFLPATVAAVLSFGGLGLGARLLWGPSWGSLAGSAGLGMIFTSAVLLRYRERLRLTVFTSLIRRAVHVDPSDVDT